MDRTADYVALIKQVIAEIMEGMPPDSEVKSEFLFDEQRKHYEIMQIGWLYERRVHGTVIHCDVIDGKIWVQHDGTDFGVADWLAVHGVPKTDIVLGFRAPDVRQYSGFAVV